MHGEVDVVSATMQNVRLGPSDSDMDKKLD